MRRIAEVCRRTGAAIAHEDDFWFDQRGRGVAVRWSPSSDDGILVACEVLRDGKTIDRVGIGTFYFDAGADAGRPHRYEIVAIDADGNRSARVAVAPAI